MWRWVLLVALVLLLYLWGEDAVMFALDGVQRGKRLNTSTADADGVVLETPAELVAQAEKVLGRPVDVHALALARMLRSEHGSGPNVEKAAMAWVALNDGAGRWDVLYTIAGPDTRFGPQKGWRYASGRDPYEGDLAIAEAVLDGRIADPTGGAVKFVHVSAFGKQPGTRTYEEVRQKWAGEGLRPFTVAGASSDFVVFRRVG